MALYTQIPTNQEKLERAISALEWQLSQDIPQKDRKIFRQTLNAYREALKSNDLLPRKIDL